MIGWQKASKPNVAQFVHFLNAELARIKKDNEEAKRLYVEALILNRRLGFRFDAAFTNERICSLHLAANESDEAKEYLCEALKLYDEYGAKTKVMQLKKAYSQFLS